MYDAPSIPAFVPPHNLEAEQALLAVLLAANKTYEQVLDAVQAEHFYDPVHGRIFAAVGKLIERGEPANAVTLKRLFDQDEDLKAAGGADYLASLQRSAINMTGAKEYARIVYDLFVRRQIIAICQDAIADAATDDLDRPATKCLEDLEGELFSVAERQGERRGMVHISVAVREAIEESEAAYKAGGRLTGVTTGLVDLDRILGGLHSSDLIILGGRPSMGKTGLAICIAEAAAAECPVGVIELEMSRPQIAQRLMARRSYIGTDAQRRGSFDGDTFHRLIDAGRVISELPIYVDDQPGASLAHVRQRARRLRRRHGLGLLIIDHIGLMRASKEAQRQGETASISEITKGLKELAKELNVPVLALSQLNRGVEQREEKRPSLSDLRQSGSIEQDADSVMFVYRDEYYLSRSKPQPGSDAPAKFAEKLNQWEDRMAAAANIAEIIVAKNRHGTIGTVTTRFDHERVSFDNLARDY